MKTLDEVIESMQLTSDVNRNYREENADVLHYLVEYRACQQHMEVVEQIRQDAVRQRDAHIKALGDLNRNEPLTWDELREMEGKPVWIEPVKEWMLLTEVDEEDCGIWLLSLDGLDYDLMLHENWQAYRKERE